MGVGVEVGVGSRGLTSQSLDNTESQVFVYVIYAATYMLQSFSDEFAVTTGQIVTLYLFH